MWAMQRSMARGFLEDEKTKLVWNLPRVLLAKNRVKLLLNMLIIAGQAIPRGGVLTVDPVGEGDSLSFRITAAGTNGRVPPHATDLLAGTAPRAVDAHAIQPFYTGMLARSVGLGVSVAAENDAIVVAARVTGKFWLTNTNNLFLQPVFALLRYQN